MNIKDIIYNVLLNLNIDDLQNLYVDKLFSNVLNDDYFWHQWLKKYDIYPTKNYKYIATNYNLKETSWINYYYAIQEKDLLMLEYFFINTLLDDDLIGVINTDSKEILNLALEYYEPEKKSIIYALARKQYKLLKILIVKNNYEFKDKVIELINKNKQYIYNSEESNILETQIDECFHPHHKSTIFKYWRNQHF